MRFVAAVDVVGRVETIIGTKRHRRVVIARSEMRDAQWQIALVHGPLTCSLEGMPVLLLLLLSGAQAWQDGLGIGIGILVVDRVLVNSSVIT